MAEAERNLILIGFMGCGKTTVGRALSEKLQIPIEDTDRLIEKRERRTISEIFQTEGEAYFRDKETELLTELAGGAGSLGTDETEAKIPGAEISGTDPPGMGTAKAGALEADSVVSIPAADADDKEKTDISGKLKVRKIISVGGGTPVRKENRKLLKKCGTVVYLRVRPETVYERLKGDTTRPLLACENPAAKIRALLESREEAYEESANIIIDVDGMQISEICEHLAGRLCAGVPEGQV